MSRIRDWLFHPWQFLIGWRRETTNSYRYQYGLFILVPIFWGCMEAFLFPRFATFGFLATVIFFEGRPGKRMALQSLFFIAWSLYLTMAWPGPKPNEPPLSFGSQENFFSPRVNLVGTIEGISNLGPRLSFTMATPGGLVKIQAPTAPFRLEQGQKVGVLGIRSPPQQPTNPGQFDSPKYLISNGIREVYQSQTLTLLESPNWFCATVNSLRYRLEQALTHSVPPSEAPLLRACLLGINQGLDPQLVEDFKASGMLHILAISGQHIGLVGIMLLQIFSFIHLPRKLGFLATALVLALYIPICGSSVSVVRSGFMFWCMLPAILLERPAFTLNNLGWAASLCLLFMPYQILSLGFQLSYAATFFLILYSRPMASVLRQMRIKNFISTYLISTLTLSLVLYLAVYPILAYGIHSCAPSSIPGNLATIALSSGMLVSAFLTLLFYPLKMSDAIPGINWIPEGFGEMAGCFSKGLSTVIHALANGPGAAQSMAHFSWFWSAILIFTLLALPYALRVGKGKALILLTLTVFCARWAFVQGHSLTQSSATVTYLDVGQGDCTLLQLPGANILIDAGPNGAGKNIILPYLRFKGINKLDFVVITHPDLDHYGGLVDLIKPIEIGHVYYPGIGAETQAWKDLISSLEREKIPLHAVHRGQALYDFKSSYLTVLSPSYPGQFPERNDLSVVMLLELTGKRFLFTGDMEAPAQRVLMSHSYPNLSGVILKVPHHGSDRSNPSDFLAAINPEISILSAGRKNRFGHPGPATVSTLGNLGSTLFATPKHGAITFQNGITKTKWSTFLPQNDSPNKL